MPQFLLLFNDAAGRPTYLLSDVLYPVLAGHVVDKTMNVKQAVQAQVFAVQSVDIDRARLEQAIAWENLVHQVRRAPGAVIRMLKEESITEETVEQLRTELTERFGYLGEKFDAPWPNAADDEE